jgi:hypothetical protein
MHTEGSFAPGSAGAAQARYDALGPLAQRVVREVATAMEFDAAEYDERVAEEVVATAREVLFAADLEVRVADRETFEAWVAEREYEVRIFGSDNVDGVAWHAAPFAGTVVATTFHEEEAAAVETCRRQALGELYRDVLHGG